MSVRVNLNASSSGSIRLPTLPGNCSSDESFKTGILEHQRVLEEYINKKYIGGYLRKKNDLGPDKTPFIQRKWTDWYVELNGSSLMFWSVKSPESINKLGAIKKKTPNFINIMDCNVYTTNDVEGAEFVFVLNSAGANRFYFQTRDQKELNEWVLALRLACFENSLIQDYYTSLILTSETFLPILKQENPSLFEGFVEIRCSGTLEWCRFWMNIHKNQSITFSPSKYSKDYFFSINNIHQAYAIYPDKLELVDQSTVLRINGEIHCHKDKQLDNTCPPFILIMGNSQFELTTILCSIFDSFNLHDRPEKYSNISLPQPNTCLYFNLNEISELNVIDIPFIDTRQQLLQLTQQKFNKMELIQNNPILLDNLEDNIEVQSIIEEPEENEFESQTTFESISSRNIQNNHINKPLASALSPKNKPKVRKTFSVKWKKNEEESSEEEEEEIKNNKNKNEVKMQQQTKESDDDDDDDDFPRINKSKPIKSSRKSLITAPIRKQQIDSDESSDNNNNNNNNKVIEQPITHQPVIQQLPLLPQVTIKDDNELINSLKTMSLYDSLPKQTVSVSRPISDINNNSNNNNQQQQQGSRPISMNKSNSSNESIKKVLNIKKNKKVVKKSNLPVDSESSNDDRDTSPIKNIKQYNNNNNNLRNSNTQNDDDDDDDAPIGMNHSATIDPYNPPYNPQMMRQSTYNNMQIEYGPDGTPYYLNEYNQYLPHPQYYDNNNNPMIMNPSFAQYNPNLQRPSNLLEAQDYMRYNNDPMMQHQKYGPLLQIPNKKQSKPSGGLVGAISAMEKQKAANKYSNSNARRSQMAHNSYIQGQGNERESTFERFKERHLMEQRIMATQSQLFSPEFNQHQQQQYPLNPQHHQQQQSLNQRTPYNNLNASLSAGSFYHNPTNIHSLHSPGSQNYLPQQEFNNINDMRNSTYRTMDDSMIYNNTHSIYGQPTTVNQQANLYPPPLRKENSYIQPNSDEQLPLQLNHEDHEEQSDDDDDKPVGALAKPSANPMFSKGRYREHTVNQIKSRKEESEDESESEPEIDDDIQEAFDEFVDAKLQMKPYAYEAPEKVYQAFQDWCQDEDWELEDLPDFKTFSFMMIQSGFVKKKKPVNLISDVQSNEEDWWYNIAVVD